MNYFAFFLFLPFFSVYAVWMWTTIFRAFWLWFAVPAFHVDPLTFAQAMAVMVVASIPLARANFKASKTKDIDWSETWNGFAIAATLPWGAMPMGWLVAKVLL